MFTIDTRTKLGAGWPVSEITVDDGLKLIIEEGHITVLWSDKPTATFHSEHQGLRLAREAG